MPMRFPNVPSVWHPASETMQVLADHIIAPVMIAVSRETLTRLAKVRHLDEAGCRSVFEQHREYFRWLASRKYQRGEIGPFRTILIAPDDLSDTKDRLSRHLPLSKPLNR
jgi:hypothetical protein